MGRTNGDDILHQCPTVIVVTSFEDVTRRAEPNMDEVAFSNEMPADELNTWAPVINVISSNVCFVLSPKPGVFTIRSLKLQSKFDWD
ncbi:MAG: hypothetical protein ACTS6G_06380 [Candidatus Hodgkinia cicadicola]